MKRNIHHEMNVSLLDLPKDILLEIASWCGVFDVEALHCVCKQLDQIMPPKPLTLDKIPKNVLSKLINHLPIPDIASLHNVCSTLDKKLPVYTAKTLEKVEKRTNYYYTERKKPFRRQGPLVSQFGLGNWGKEIQWYRNNMQHGDCFIYRKDVLWKRKYFEYNQLLYGCKFHKNGSVKTFSIPRPKNRFPLCKIEYFENGNVYSFYDEREIDEETGLFPQYGFDIKGTLRSIEYLKINLRGRHISVKKELYDKQGNMLYFCNYSQNSPFLMGFMEGAYWHRNVGNRSMSVYILPMAEGSIDEYGVKFGVWNYYELDSYGNRYLYEKVEYFKGKLDGLYIRYRLKSTSALGQYVVLDFHVPYKMGDRHGTYKKVDDRSIVILSGTYIYGVPLGEWIYKKTIIDCTLNSLFS